MFYDDGVKTKDAYKKLKRFNKYSESNIEQKVKIVDFNKETGDILIYNETTNSNRYMIMQDFIYNVKCGVYKVKNIHELKNWDKLCFYL